MVPLFCESLLLEWEVLAGVWKLLPLFFPDCRQSWRGMGGRVGQTDRQTESKQSTRTAPFFFLTLLYPIIPISLSLSSGLFCHFFSDSPPMLFSPLVFQE